MRGGGGFGAGNSPSLSETSRSRRVAASMPRSSISLATGEPGQPCAARPEQTRGLGGIDPLGGQGVACRPPSPNATGLGDGDHALCELAGVDAALCEQLTRRALVCRLGQRKQYVLARDLLVAELDGLSFACSIRVLV